LISRRERRGPANAANAALSATSARAWASRTFASSRWSPGCATPAGSGPGPPGRLAPRASRPPPWTSSSRNRARSTAATAW